MKGEGSSSVATCTGVAIGLSWAGVYGDCCTGIGASGAW